jgi:starch-binding outer membrane protein, SusD/RagB family
MYAPDLGLQRCASGTDTGNPDFYLPLQIARFQAEDVSERLQAMPAGTLPNLESVLGELAAYAGYTYTLLAESFCQAAIDVGPALNPPQLFEMAEQRFTAAIGNARASGNRDIEHMALVGRARARLGLGNTAGAADDAALVPQGYVKHATHSNVTGRRQNRLWLANYRNRTATVPPAYRDLRVGGVEDLRVTAIDARQNGNDGETPLWHQRKYTDGNVPIPIASWQEAQLILAEAEGGQTAVDAINQLRIAAGLPTFSSTDPAEIRARVIEERRRELWLQGNRMGDMLRLDLPWASGNNHKNQPYGTQTCLPLPQSEIDNNPNI